LYDSAAPTFVRVLYYWPAVAECDDLWSQKVVRGWDGYDAVFARGTSNPILRRGLEGGFINLRIASMMS